MDPRAAELWKHAPAILEKLDGVIGKPRNVAKEELLSVLGLDGSVVSVDDAKPGVEDFEYALQAAVLNRLESGDEATCQEVAEIVDVASDVVAELFERAAAPGASPAETDRCKAWWMMLVAATEDTTKLVPARLLVRLVEVFEVSLVRLQTASLKLASQRLREFDAKQDAEDKKAEEGGADAKLMKDRETKRFEERKKLVQQLGISPNGHLYLTLTSLLKQVSTRLGGSIHSSLRARISLLLENLLALDHKAIANNQKLRTSDYVQLEDLDSEVQATFHTEDAGKASSLGNDPVVDYELYKSFWGLQEPLQFAEKLFEKPDSWLSFHSSLSKLLTLFVKYPAQDNETQPWAEQEPAPLRQAPRSRGLGVQLDDPGFRQQFLTQVLIAFQAMEQEVSSRGKTGGIIAVQSDSIRKEYAELKRLVEDSLTQTRKGFPDMLKHVLDREAHWVSWKGFGCREYERESLEMLTGKPVLFDAMSDSLEALQRAKPKLAAHVNSMLKTLKNPEWRVPAPVATSDEEALRSRMRAQQTRVMCDRYMERLETEDDPEAGIEDEYKAKKNKVFMWQTRRLFGQQYLPVYARKDVYGKTDFMDFLRAAKNGPPAAPLAAPAAEAEAGEPTEAAAAAEEDAASPPAAAEADASSGPDAAEEVAIAQPDPGDADAPAAVAAEGADAAKAADTASKSTKREAPAADAAEASSAAKKAKSASEFDGELKSFT